MEHSGFNDKLKAQPQKCYTWRSFLGSEEPSLTLLHSAKLQRMNSNPISNCWHSKSAIFISRNINYNIKLSLWLHVGTHIIYIYIGRALYTRSRNENNRQSLKRRILKALEIQQIRPMMNLDTGLILDQSWTPLFVQGAEVTRPEVSWREPQTLFKECNSQGTPTAEDDPQV